MISILVTARARADLEKCTWLFTRKQGLCVHSRKSKKNLWNTWWINSFKSWRSSFSWTTQNLSKCMVISQTASTFTCWWNTWRKDPFTPSWRRTKSFLKRKPQRKSNKYVRGSRKCMITILCTGILNLKILSFHM